MPQTQPQQVRKTNVLPFKRKEAPNTEETLTNEQMFIDKYGNEHPMWELSAPVERKVFQPGTPEFDAAQKRSEARLTVADPGLVDVLDERELCDPIDRSTPKLADVLNKVKGRWQEVKLNDLRRAHELADFQQLQHREREDEVYAFKTRVARAFNHGATTEDVLNVLPDKGVHRLWVQDVAKEYGNG